MMRAFLVALFALAAACPSRAAKLSAADTAWIAKCADQLKRERATKTTTRKYCSCMHEYFEDNDNVSQSDMEHMFPPAHRLCMRQAGWR